MLIHVHRHRRPFLLALFLLCGLAIQARAFQTPPQSTDPSPGPDPAAAAASAANVPSAPAGTRPAPLEATLLQLLDQARQLQVLAGLDAQDPRHARAQAAVRQLKGQQRGLLRQLSTRLVADSHNEATLVQTLLDFLASPAGAGAQATLQPVLAELRVHAKLSAEQLRSLRRLMNAPTGAELPIGESDRQAAQRLMDSLKNEAVLAQAAREREWRGLELPAHTVVLSFDDGPHPQYTPQILATLAQHDLKALFFQIGRNLGERNKGVIQFSRNEDLEKRIVAAGHAIGNHSYSHAKLPRYSEAQVKEEIQLTEALLALAVPEGPARTGFFRAPYGAVNDVVLAETESQHLRLVLWNVDSMDWADPSPASIVRRVMAELKKAGRGIILMHDIHAHSVEALPLLIEALKAEGYRFAHWDGQGFSLTAPSGAGS